MKPIKRYHLILVPVEGVHGGYVRYEHYRDVELHNEVLEARREELLDRWKALQVQLEQAEYALAQEKATSEALEARCKEYNEKFLQSLKRTSRSLSLSLGLAIVLLLTIALG
jgi:hypothetical protein